MKWKLREFKDNSNELKQYSSIIRTLLLQRGINSDAEASSFFELDYNSGLLDSFLFKDMDKLTDRVKKALKNREKVGIFGDHDVDGVTSSTVLAESLENLGLEVQVYIPDKITEGHGMNKKAIDEFKDSGITLMFTVDCGIGDLEQVSYAKDLGIDVIITDHHLQKEKLPDALAIINPNVLTCNYPFKGLAGVGVAFKVAVAIYKKLNPEEVEKLKWLLDLVCIGTIADCMPLLGENRVLVKYGLLVLSKTRRAGLKEMIKIGKLDVCEGKLPNSDLIGFQIGPRLNAAGRMTHARDAYNLLKESDVQTAEIMARKIESSNIERRKLTDKLVREVERKVKNEFQDKKFIFIADENYPIGVVGIIAGRIANKFSKPTGIFQKEGDISRGSFRSACGINIVDILKNAEDYLEKYGGHESAAGAVIKNSNIDSFVSFVNDNISSKFFGKYGNDDIFADVKINSRDINLDLIEEIYKFEPFGESNSKPNFWITDLELLDAKIVGNSGKHLKLVLRTSDGFVLDAIGFGIGGDIDKLNNSKRIEIIGNLEKNIWNGSIKPQINITHWRKV